MQSAERLCNIQDELNYLSGKVDRELRLIKELIKRIIDILKPKYEN
tara:strand:+ start:2621 stop:2758 length:138 start_codon:yes stop_codon:yes gene_type:complete